MNKDYLIQLTNNLYKLTLLFPKKEPLRYKMRDLATEILANCNEKCSRYIEVLDSFFEVAKAQTWVRQEEILHLQQEYSRLGEEPKNEGTEEPKNEGTEEPKNEADTTIDVKHSVFNKEQKRGLSDRHQKIIKFLEQNRKAQVIDIQKILPQVTKRTVRRDFRDLLEQGLVERVGEKQETYYQLNSNLKSQNAK